MFRSLLSLGLLSLYAYFAWVTWALPSAENKSVACAAWFSRPQPHWVRLSACELDFERAVVESRNGEFETLANRRKGLSAQLYTEPPVWVTVWIPVQEEQFPGATVRAAYRLSSHELVNWVNEIERADEALKEQLWADPVPFRRLARLTVLEGYAEKGAPIGLARAFGMAGSPLLWAIVPGEPPARKFPLLAHLVGACGVAVLIFEIRRYARKKRDVQLKIENEEELELGALQELRSAKDELTKRGEDVSMKGRE